MIVQLTLSLVVAIVNLPPIANQNVNSRKLSLEKRKFLFPAGDKRLWPNGIVYYKWAANRKFNNIGDYEAVREAMRWYENHTCIQWKEYNMNNRALDRYSNFVEIGSNTEIDRCVVDGIGRQHGSHNTNMFLGLKCITQYIILHELSHVVGMIHEHMRHDRGEHLEVLLSRINKSAAAQFSLMNTYNYAPYDLGSVMQYSLSLGAKVAGEKVFKIHDIDLEFLANMEQGVLSFYDLLSVNRAYRCSAHCNPKTSPVCQNSGFLNFKCQCTCPDFFHKGGSCDVITTDSDCGGLIDLTSSSDPVTLKSPGYPYKYPTGKKCIWFIKGPVDSSISLNINGFDIANNSKFAAKHHDCGHFLQIRYNLLAQEGPRFCGKILKKIVGTTRLHDSNMMMVEFNTEKGIYTAKGFSAVVSAVDRETIIVCNFDIPDACPLTQDKSNDVDWRRRKYGSLLIPCPLTGFGGSGWYLCSYSNFRNTRARYLTARLSASKRCVKFSYQMSGTPLLSRLLVKKIQDGQEVIVWKKEFDESVARRWYQARTNVTGERPYQIVFEADFQHAFYSTIAIDELNISPGLCTVQNSYTK